jgi:hypothetical protein
MLDAVFARGTTPVHYYEIPYSAEDVQKVSVSYRQKGKNIVIKRGECEVTDGYIKVVLTQEDTLKFTEGETISQVKILTSDGEVLRSLDHYIRVLDTFDEEVF